MLSIDNILSNSVGHTIDLTEDSVTQVGGNIIVSKIYSKKENFYHLF